MIRDVCQSVMRSDAILYSTVSCRDRTVDCSSREDTDMQNVLLLTQTTARLLAVSQPDDVSPFFLLFRC